MQNDFSLSPLIRPALCLITGIIAGRYVTYAEEMVFAILLGLLAAAFLLRKSGMWQSLCICLVCAAVGCLLCLHRQRQMLVSWPEEEQEYELVVVSEPVQRGKTLAADALLAATGQKIQLRLMPGEESLNIGDGLIVFSQLKPLSAQGNYRTFLETHGYTGEVFAWSNRWHHAVISLQGIGVLNRTRLFFMMQRHRLLEQFSSNIRDQDHYAILAAMALGDKSAVSRQQKEQFSQAGTSHLLALSGLHLGIIYMLLTLLLRSRRQQLVNQLLIVGCIWAFVLLVGMSPSVVRAAVMISVYAFVSLLNRGKTPINTLAFTAIIMLTANPYSLFDAGFQLSFCSVLAILLFVPLLTRLISQQWLDRHKIVRILWSMMVVSVAAQIGTAPLVAYYFGRFPVYFLLANLVSIPLATAILYTMFVVLLFTWWPAAQAVLAVVPSTLAFWLSSWTSAIAALPYASIEGISPTILQVAAAYVFIACLWYLLHYYVCSIKKECSM